MIEDLERDRILPLSKGVSVIVPSDVLQYSISGNITLYKGALSIDPT